jgi:hypothetical protein
VLKRIRFATQAGEGDEFAERWRAAVASVLAAPPGAIPVRVVACTVLPGMTPGAVHDGISIEWYKGPAHLERLEWWLASPGGKVVDELLAPVIDLDSSPVMVAEEHVLRGSDWLETRWRDGGDKLKHMAIARRAAGLTPAEFSDRWKSRAGKVGRVDIPEVARGQAYVQNHPVPRPEGSWAYDALNEVYFDDAEGVRTRMAFFAGSPREDDLVGDNWFVVAREEVIRLRSDDKAATAHELREQSWLD